MDLQTTLAAFEKKWEALTPKYEISEYWNVRDRYGIATELINRPLAARMGNYAFTFITSHLFPWAYLFGFLGIPDPSAVEFESGWEVIGNLFLSNSIIFTVAAFFILSSLSLPIAVSIWLIQRYRGFFGGRVVKAAVAQHKLREKYLNCAGVVLSACCIIGFVIDFNRCFIPITDGLPLMLTNLTKHGLHDLQTYINVGKEELRDLLNNQLIPISDSLVSTALVEFEEVTGNMSNQVAQAVNMTLLSGGFDRLIPEVIMAKEMFGVMTADSALLVTDFNGMRYQYAGSMAGILQAFTKCQQVLSLPGMTELCAEIPNPIHMPLIQGKVPTVNLTETENILDSLQVEAMKEGFANYKHFLAEQIGNNTLPTTGIREAIVGEVTKFIGKVPWEEFDPVSKEVIDHIISEIELFYQTYYLQKIRSIAKLLTALVSIYGVLILSAVATGMWATYRLPFPCYDRGELSKFASHVLARSQVLTVLTYSWFGIPAGALVLVCSYLTTPLFWVYTREIIPAIIDRMDSMNIPRIHDITPAQNSSMFVHLYIQPLLETCDEDGGTLQAIGFTKSNFKSVFGGLDEVQWPCPDEYKADLERTIRRLDDFCVPGGHNTPEQLSQHTSLLNLPTINFTKVSSAIDSLRLFNLSGEEFTSQSLAMKLGSIENSLRQMGIPEAKMIADDLDQAQMYLYKTQEKIYDVDILMSKLKAIQTEVTEILKSLKDHIFSIISTLDSLRDILATVTSEFVNSSTSKAISLLNRTRVKTRALTLELIDFVIAKSLKCEIISTLYRVASETLYLYITAHLNGSWLAGIGVCGSFIACFVLSLFMTKYFQEIIDYQKPKEVPRAHGAAIGLPPGLLRPPFTRAGEASLPERQRKIREKWRESAFRISTARTFAVEGAVRNSRQTDNQVNSSVHVMPMLASAEGLQTSPHKYLPDWALEDASKHTRKKSYAARVPGTFVDPEHIDMSVDE